MLELGNDVVDRPLVSEGLLASFPALLHRSGSLLDLLSELVIYSKTIYCLK